MAPISSELNDVVIKVRGLVNRFDSRIIHDHIDLDVFRGKALGLVGASGSGKSVLLRSIIELIEPNEGNVEIFGQKIGEVESSAMRRLEMRGVSCFKKVRCFRRKLWPKISRLHFESTR
jgi:phospholipid/cholesterol/gamma-HCH transport system ATP-binding protein